MTAFLWNERNGRLHASIDQARMDISGGKAKNKIKKGKEKERPREYLNTQEQGNSIALPEDIVRVTSRDLCLLDIATQEKCKEKAENR